MPGGWAHTRGRLTKRVDVECQGELGRPALVRKGHEWDWWPRGVFRGSATTLPPEAPQKWGSLGLHVSSHGTHGHPHLFWTVFQEWGSTWEGAELPGGSGGQAADLALGQLHASLRGH